MGAAIRKLGRNYNVDQRITKQLSKEKLPNAPRHATEAALIKQHAAELSDVDRANIPGLEQVQTEKISTLEERLKSVQISTTTSHRDVNNVEFDPRKNLPATTERPLPVAHRDLQTAPTAPVLDDLYWTGIREPAVVPPGRLKLSNIVTLLKDVNLLQQQQQNQPSDVGDVAVAEKYQISVQDVENIRKHFGIFLLYDEKTAMMTQEERVHAAGEKGRKIHHLPADIIENRYNTHWVYPFEERDAHLGMLRGYYYSYKHAGGIDLGDPDEKVREWRETERVNKIDNLHRPKIDREEIDEADERGQRIQKREAIRREQREQQQQQELAEKEADQLERVQPYALNKGRQSSVSGSTKFKENADDIMDRGANPGTIYKSSRRESSENG